MMNKKYSLSIFILLMLTTASAFSIPFIGGEERTGSDLNLNEIGNNINEIDLIKEGFSLDNFWLFNIVGDDRITTGDTVTYETSMRWDPDGSICENNPDGYHMYGFWVEGPGIDGNSEEIYNNIGQDVWLYCDGTYSDIDVEFSVPEETGTFEYDLKLAGYQSSIDSQPSFDNVWTAGSDSVEVKSEIPEPVADFDFSGDNKVGDDITFAGDLSSGDIEEYKWYIDGSRVGSGQIFDYSFNSPGTYQIELEVIDSLDRSDTKGTTIEIEENLPEIEASLNVDSNIKMGDNLELDARSSEGENLDYSWRVEDSRGEDVYSDSLASHTYTNEPGTYTIRLEVEDSHGQTDTTSTEVNVKPKNPVINSIEASDSITLGEMMTVRGEAEHPNDLELDYSWNNGDSGEITDYVFDEKGTKEIELTVSDGYNEVNELVEVDVSNEIDSPPQNPESSLRDTLSDFLNDIFGGWFTFSVTQPIDERVDSGDLVEETLSVNDDVNIDNDYSDGEVNYVYGQWTITKGDEVIEEGDWTELEQTSFSHEFSESFVEDGEYSYIVILAEASSEFENGEWSDYNINRLDSEKYTFRVEGHDVSTPPDPSQSLGDWFSGIVSRLIFW